MLQGCNVEQASYGLAICAERVALSKAVSEGYIRFKALAVSTDLVKEHCSPCGACRLAYPVFCFGISLKIVLV